MIIKKICRKIINTYRRERQKKNCDVGKIVFLNLGDILTPCNGVITTVQYIIASRMLDIEEIENGKQCVWAYKINTRKFSEDEKNKHNDTFLKLINSLKKNGYSPFYDMEQLPELVVNGPCIVNHGTHRIGYFALNNPTIQLPFRYVWDSSFPLNGFDYWKQNGIEESVLKCLEDKLNSVLAERIRTYLSGYCKEEFFYTVEKEIKKFGNIIESTKLKKNNGIYVLFNFRLDKQLLYVDKKQLLSEPVQEIQKLLNIDDKSWGKLGNTVTESINIENEIIFGE